MVDFHYGKIFIGSESGIFMTGTNVAGNMVAAAHGFDAGNWDKMFKIVRALGSEDSVPDLKVEFANETIPLEEFLIKHVRRYGEAHAFFQGVAPFDIYSHLPYGLKHHPDKLGVSQSEAPGLLERFNQFVWSETPEAWNRYHSARKIVQGVASDNLLLYDNGDTKLLTEALGNVVRVRDFHGLDSLPEVEGVLGDVDAIESQFKDIPPERFLDYLSRAGWKRQGQRVGIINRLKPEWKRIAKQTEASLEELGSEYRELYVEIFG